MFISNYHTLEMADSIYSYIVDYFYKNFYPPTFSEIRAYTGLKSNTSIINYLNILSDNNYIQFNRTSNRSITLLHFHIRHNDSFHLQKFKLSKLDQELYGYIFDFFTTHLYPPTYDDILSSGLLNSKSSISTHMKILSDKGLLRFSSPNSSRSYSILHCSIYPSRVE